jgi:WD40 repeat protein
VVYSPDGTKIASGSYDKTLKIWNAQTGQCVSTRGHSGYVAAISYSCLFSSVRCVLTIEHRSVCSVCFRPDGKYVASGSRDETVKIWETSTGHCQSTCTQCKFIKKKSPYFFKQFFVCMLTDLNAFRYVYAVKWSPDGMSLASASEDKTVRIRGASLESKVDV